MTGYSSRFSAGFLGDDPGKLTVIITEEVARIGLSRYVTAT